MPTSSTPRYPEFYLTLAKVGQVKLTVHAADDAYIRTEDDAPAIINGVPYLFNAHMSYEDAPHLGGKAWRIRAGSLYMRRKTERWQDADKVTSKARSLVYDAMQAAMNEWAAQHGRALAQGEIAAKLDDAERKIHEAEELEAKAKALREQAATLRAQAGEVPTEIKQERIAPAFTREEIK
jgi:hypothetical protein